MGGESQPKLENLSFRRAKAVVQCTSAGGGSMNNHAHSLGVVQLQPRPYFQRWKHDNLV